MVSMVENQHIFPPGNRRNSHASGTTRRSFIQSAAAAAAGFSIGSSVRGLAQTSRRSNEGTPPLSEFDYAQIQLAPGLPQQQFEQNHQLLLGMDEDSLLRPFRVREGMPAPGVEMGGWYSTYAFAPACPYGQWLSALSRFYAATGDVATRAKIDRLVRGYAATLEPEGRFYQHYRFPAYTYDKLVLGLCEAHAYANHPTALEVLSRTTDIVLPYLPPKAMPHQETPVVAGEDFTRHVSDESYTMPENLFLAWKRTGGRRYFELAKRFLFNDEYFDPLSRGENVMPGRHAYSHMNSLSSAASAYLALGEEKYLKAAKNAFTFVQEQSYATGGWGPREHFIEPGSGGLGEGLNSEHASFETPCGAYAHFKLTRYLLRITRDSRYGDSMEQVMYNTVLGARPIQPDGSAFYYSDYTLNASKRYFGAKWPCCSGTLPQIAADYRISAYFRSSDDVYVNLYLPSRLSWKVRDAQYSLIQVTEYPYDSHIRLELTGSTPATFAVFLRIPEWAKGASLTVNGMRDSRTLSPGAFAEVRREWKSGDRIELDLPLAARIEPVDAQHPDTVALANGPLVLMPLRDVAFDQAQGSLTRAVLLSARQSSGKSHEWRMASGGRELTLKPFMDIEDEAYTTYVKVLPA
jgi:DUF1680 family protein